MNRSSFVQAGTMAAVGISTRAGLAASADAETVVVGTLVSATIAPLYLGVAKGFFSRDGLTVQLEPAASGAAVVPGVLSNSLQFGYSNVISLMLAVQRGLPLRAVASVGLTVPPGSGPQTGRASTAITVRSDSPIRTAKDLSGKVVGVNSLRGIEEVTCRNSIDVNGGDSTAVRFIEVSFAETVAAVDRGTISAGFVIEPYTTSALSSQQRIWCDRSPTCRIRRRKYRFTSPRVDSPSSIRTRFGNSWQHWIPP